MQNWANVAVYLAYDDILPVQSKMQNNMLLLKLINLLFPENHSMAEAGTGWQNYAAPG